METYDQQLSEARRELDRLDAELVALINKRARLAQTIGQVKAAAGQRVYAPDREKQVLDQVCCANQGPIGDSALRAIYREIMSASLSLERSPRLAILGPAASFSHLAGKKRFGSSVEFEMLSSITAVFDAVRHGSVELGLVPVENSSVGGVGETLDGLIERDVRICGEVFLAIHHHLLARVPLDAVKRVYSKPEVAAQCERWLAASGLLPLVEPASSSSAAAERAAQEEGAAAIASDLAAQHFQLHSIAEFIEDEPDNVTRFVVLGDRPSPPTGRDKTSVVFSVGHKPGLLAGALEVLRNARINMTRIESRRSRTKKWDYWFFVDVEGHAESPEVATALRQTAERCAHWKVLGSYPAAEEAL